METQYIFIYILTEMKQIMQDANSKGITYISVQFVLPSTITNLELAWVFFRKISFLKLGLT